jgi:hypothetical protein
MEDILGVYSTEGVLLTISLMMSNFIYDGKNEGLGAHESLKVAWMTDIKSDLVNARAKSLMHLLPLQWTPKVVP